MADQSSISATTLFEEESMLRMRASKVAWADSFLSIQVDFGSHDADFELHRPEDETKSKRDLSDSLDFDARTSPSFSRSSATPTPTVHSAKKDVSHKFLDTPILPPDIPGIEILGPATPPGFLLKCKNCTMKGTVSASQGSFTIGSKHLTSDFFSGISDILDNPVSGFVKLETTGLAAHIELESSIPAGFPVNLVRVSLPEIALTPFRTYAQAPDYHPCVLLQSMRRERVVGFLSFIFQKHNA